MDTEKKTPRKGIGILAQHQYRHTEYCEAVHHMPGPAVYAATRDCIIL